MLFEEIKSDILDTIVLAFPTVYVWNFRSPLEKPGWYMHINDQHLILHVLSEVPYQGIGTRQHLVLAYIGAIELADPLLFEKVTEHINNVNV